MIVQYDRFGEDDDRAAPLCGTRLDLRCGGTFDGNVHPNVIPRRRDVRKGREAILRLAPKPDREGVAARQHGVGRNPIKQQLLRQLYGDAGINAMRAIKLSLDPNGSLASGVIFPAQ